ncbi:relaxase [Pseudothauera nasutitermitis]|uniref:Relaxase n=1 Tax=Pseudothauera nasutitermitis TaxID=2565930 RepID=A0A4S4B229_9RHOO|nr:MobH family relaxase [Pseudothauera nasutitermitis]THF64958.1 relaxase [Pseudothauera nasutitermitis]
MATPPAAVRSYPASDPGFAALPVDELLAGEADLIARIKLCYGADRDGFERDILSLARRYAACVHLLPATAGNYFSTPGGLLRLGLETAFFSLQGTDAHIFSGRTSISSRHQLEPRWRHATFIAGLCCELHRLMSHVIVTDDAGAVWPAFLQPLADWLAARGSARYFLRWRPEAAEARGLGLFALPLVVPPAVMADLAEGNTVIVPHLLASIGGIPVYRERNVLDELVRRSLALVIDRNLAASADRYGSPQYGSHLERYLVDALRRLAGANSAWTPNTEKSRLWYGQDGLFLVWPGGAEDVRQLLEADQLAGIPKAPETMLELLLAASVFEAAEAERPFWSILPPGAKSPLDAVKLSTPAILLVGIDPPPVPLPQALAVEPGAAPPPPATPPVSPPAPPAAPPPGGTQLPLIPPSDPPAEETASTVPLATSVEALPPEPAPPPPPRFALQAPLRLNPVVRAALADALRTLDEDGDAAACIVADGIFVPLETFARHGVQPSLAIRALVETKLLVKPGGHDGPPTRSHDINGATSLGVVLSPHCVGGGDPAGVTTPPAQQG